MLITPFYGQILILVLLAVCCLRTYFVENTRLDALALFAPLTLVITILQILNWGLNISEVVLLILTIIVFITNYRSFIRFCNHLYVDTYSLAFVISSSISLVLIVVAGIFLTLNRPIPLDAEKYQVKISSTYYSANSDGTYTESTDVFDDKSLKLTVYEPSLDNKNRESDIILFMVPDKRAPKMAYEPYLILMAKTGYKIYFGEFGFTTVDDYARLKSHTILRRNLIHDSRQYDNPVEYFLKNSKYFYAYAHEYEVLTNIADKKEAHLKKFAVVGDGICALSFARIQNPARPVYAGISLNTIPEYKTAGYGFIEQMDPLYAKFRFGLKQDRTNHVPSYAAMITKNALEAVNDIK